MAGVSNLQLPLVGRQSELDQLNAALGRASSGQPSVVLIEGEAGIGKTRLITEFARRTSNQARHLHGEASRLDRGSPFHLWQPVLTKIASLSASGLAPVWRGALARLIPSLGMADEPSPEANPEDERLKLFEAVLRLVDGLTVGPLVIALDNLHWADDSSLQLLGYLARSLNDQPILLLGTMRPEEASPYLIDLYVSLEQRGVLTRVPLRRLNANEIEELVASLSDEVETHHLSHELYRRSGGNPLFAIELFRVFKEAGGWSAEIDAMSPSEMYGQPVGAAFRRLMDWRLARLDEVSRHIVTVGATLGPEWDRRLITRASGLEEEVVGTALEVLSDSQFIVKLGAQPQRYAIAHERIAEIALDSIALSRQQLLNQWAGEAWEELIQEGVVTAPPERLADHFSLAGDQAKTFHYIGQAAERAIAWSAPTEAMIHCYQLVALAEENDTDLLIEAYRKLGKLHLAHGPVERAVENLQAAARVASDQPPAKVAELLAELAASYAAAGKYAEAATTASDGLTKARAVSGLEGLAAKLLALEASAWALLESDTERSVAKLLAAESECQAAGSAAGAKVGMLRCRLTLAGLAAATGLIDQAISHYRVAAGYADAAGDYANQVICLNNAGYYLMLQGRSAEAAGLLAEGRQVAERRGLLAGRIILLSTEGELALRQADIERAERSLVEAFELTDRIDFPDRKAAALAGLAGLAQCRLEHGDPTRAIELHQAAIGICEDFSLAHQKALCLLGIVESWLALHQPDRIGEDLATARRLIETGGWGSAEAELLRHRGDVGRSQWRPSDGGRPFQPGGRDVCQRRRSLRDGAGPPGGGKLPAKLGSAPLQPFRRLTPANLHVNIPLDNAISRQGGVFATNNSDVQPVRATVARLQDGEEIAWRVADVAATVGCQTDKRRLFGRELEGQVVAGGWFVERRPALRDLGGEELFDVALVSRPHHAEVNFLAGAIAGDGPGMLGQQFAQPFALRDLESHPHALWEDNASGWRRVEEWVG